MTLKFLVNSCLSQFSAADNKKFPLQPVEPLIQSGVKTNLKFLPLPLLCATGFPAEPLGAKKNKCTWGFT